MDTLLAKAYELLIWHSKGGQTPLETLNRLWRKQPFVLRSPQHLAALPAIEEHQLTVRLESWLLKRILQLVDDTFHQGADPKAFEPILVIERDGREFLIDGGNRINYWKKHNDQGPHPVLRIIVGE